MPIIVYLLLYQGEYQYKTLPILTEKVAELDSKNHSFKNKLSVVCFLGNDQPKYKASLFNINQLIYKRYQEKPFFQMVAFIPTSAKPEFTKTIEELAGFTNLEKWHFIFEEEKKINEVFKSLKTPCKLDKDLYNPHAFIIDTALRLRGRSRTSKNHCGYDTTNVSELKKEMRDDISILYYAGLKDVEILK
jgi:hypothetical protein